MHQDDVARLRLAFVDFVPIAQARPVVCGHQPGERRLLLLALEIGRVDVQHAAAGRGLRLRSRAHLRGLHRRARSRRRDPSWSAGPRTRCRARGPECCRRSGRAPCSPGAPPRGTRARRPCAAAVARPSSRPRPLRRYATSTVALRLSSPEISHSNPRQIRVGGSTTNAPARTPLAARIGAAARHANTQAKIKYFIRVECSPGGGTTVLRSPGTKWDDYRIAFPRHDDTVM